MIAKFTYLKIAKAFINHCTHPGKWSIVLGDDMKYWVVTNRQASKLVKQGYEILDTLRS